MARYRIRRCNGNREAWMLIALRDDGTEIDSNGGWTTSYSVDTLLRGTPGNKHLTPRPDDTVELIPGENVATVEPLPTTRAIKKRTREIFRDEGLIPAVKHYRAVLWNNGNGSDPGLKTSIDLIRDKWGPAK